jgi:glycosyltransferase involved in cell wall biosynthesis
MALMAPVLTSNHGQMHEIINDRIDGFLCKNDPRNILDILVFIKNNPELARQVGRKGWERIQSEFNWQHNVDVTLKCFQRALLN